MIGPVNHRHGIAPTRNTPLAEPANGVGTAAAGSPAAANPLDVPGASPFEPTAEQKTAARDRFSSLASSTRHQVQQMLPHEDPHVSEEREQQAIGGENGAAKMLDLGGNPRKGLALTVHGINDSPKGVAGLSQQALDTGAATRTLAWDDNYRRLGDTAKDLSTQLGSWLDSHPGAPLSVSAHSMGSRVTLAALDDLNKHGKLDGHKVDVNLVAPALGGFGSANLTALAPGFVDGAIKNLRPSRDMGSSSAFQKQLEGIRLPGNVSVRVFTGGKDDIIDQTMPGFGKIVRNLNAQVIDFPEADHVGAAAAAAEWLARNGR